MSGHAVFSSVPTVQSFMYLLCCI